MVLQPFFEVDQSLVDLTSAFESRCDPDFLELHAERVHALIRQIVIELIFVARVLPDARLNHVLWLLHLVRALRLEDHHLSDAPLAEHVIPSHDLQ